MPNTTVLAAASGLPKNADSVAALTALWHETEAALYRGPYPDHLMSLMTKSQAALMRRIIDTPCATERDLAAKLKFAAFIVESDWSGEKVETDIIARIAGDYDRLCRESQAAEAA